MHKDKNSLLHLNNKTENKDELKIIISNLSSKRVHKTLDNFLCFQDIFLTITSGSGQQP